MLVAFMGLPSSGKSSVSKALADVSGGACFCEPEESEWSPLISRRSQTGSFSAITWFRGVRILGLYDAQKAHLDGRLAIVDSYYDKLLSLYLGQSGLEWLIGKEDPYFEVAKKMAEVDYLLLPDVDCLVFLKLSKDVWLSFMANRGRDFDAGANLQKHFILQEAMYTAAKHYSDSKNIRLVVQEQSISSPKYIAEKIAESLAIK